MGFSDELKKARNLLAGLKIELSELGAEQPVMVDIDSLDNAKDALEQAKKNAETLKDAIYKTNKELENTTKNASAFDNALKTAQKRLQDLPNSSKKVGKSITNHLSNPAMIFGGILGGLFVSAMKLDQAVGAMGKSLNISYNEATKLNNEFADTLRFSTDSMLTQAK